MWLHHCAAAAFKQRLDGQLLGIRIARPAPPSVSHRKGARISMCLLPTPFRAHVIWRLISEERGLQSASLVQRSHPCSYWCMSPFRFWCLHTEGSASTNYWQAQIWKLHLHLPISITVCLQRLALSACGCVSLGSVHAAGALATHMPQCHPEGGMLNRNHVK